MQGIADAVAQVSGLGRDCLNRGWGPFLDVEKRRFVPIGMPWFRTSANRQHTEPSCLLLVALLVTIGLCSSPLMAQFSQQGPKLVGTGVVGGSLQGVSVSVSADGNTAIMGGNGDNSGDNSSVGAAWIFTRNGGVWTQQGSKLVGVGAVGGAGQGYSVSISSDGNTAIVGGRFDNSGAGAAWIFTRNEGVWTQQGPKLVGTNAVGSAQQGISVAVSGDGSTAIVGGWSDHSGVGAAWIFARSGGVWTQQGTKLWGTDVVGTAHQGSSVSIAADGNTVIVGGDNDNSVAGAAWIFTRSGGVWSQQGPKLVGTGTAGALQGSAVSLSADGNTAIVGGPGDSGVAIMNFLSSQGAAWIFARSSGVWIQQGSKLVGTGGDGAQQGQSVSLSGDGNTAIVGGPADGGAPGAVWIFRRSGGVWGQQGSKLLGTGAAGAAGQGQSVSLSADGSTAVAGGPYDDGSSGNRLVPWIGAAWVFVTPLADLAITITSDAGAMTQPNTTVRYAITVVNHGPGASSGVTVTDVLPTGVTFVSAIPSQGSCSGATTVACSIGTLADGAAATVTIAVTTGITAGLFSNTARVTATTPDPDLSNDSSTTTLDIAPARRRRAA
jgi:uncharacterized repeat protein (TIGR01451 family)